MEADSGERTLYPEERNDSKVVEPESPRLVTEGPRMSI